MVLDTVKARTFIKMGIDMMANGNMEFKKVMGNSIMPLVICMKDNSQIEDLMDTGNLLMQMGIYFKGSILMVNYLESLS
jgi:hypothetical protein